MITTAAKLCLTRFPCCKNVPIEKTNNIEKAGDLNLYTNLTRSEFVINATKQKKPASPSPNKCPKSFNNTYPISRFLSQIESKDRL